MSEDNKEFGKNEDVEILENERDLVLEHDYDGIKELDHPLPLWWIFTFVGTIVFAVPYYFYHVHAGGPTSRTEMNEELARIHKIQSDYEAKVGGFDVDKFNRFAASEEAKTIGADTYKSSCSACHGGAGEGSIGPNLTDEYWLNGNGKLVSVYETIAKGVTAKGMPAWKQSLSEEQLMAVTDYVLKFKKIEGKEPQGEMVKE